MNIAILSCNTGGGHNSAAAAIARELDAQGHTYKIYNTLDFLPPSSARLISRGHDFAYRHAPKLRCGLPLRGEAPAGAAV